jgi:ribonuclease Z
MRLSVLGSGTCQLWQRRSSPSYLVEAGGMKLMLDMGQGSLRRLVEAGHQAAGLDAVLISHHHLDHMADLLPLLFGLNYDPDLSARGKITLLASKKFEHVLEGLEAVYGKWINPGEPGLKKVFLSPGDSVQLGGVKIITSEVRHLETSIGFRIEHGGRSLVYPGDSAYCEPVLELARGADLLIAHVGGDDDNIKPKHLYPRAAGELAARAGVKALLLSHIYHPMNPDAAVKSAAREFDGPIQAADDLMTADIQPDGVEYCIQRLASKD